MIYVQDNYVLKFQQLLSRKVIVTLKIFFQHNLESFEINTKENVCNQKYFFTIYTVIVIFFF